MSNQPNNATIVSTCNQRLTALAKFVKTKTEMSIDGEPTNLAALTDIYQAGIDTRAALVPIRVALEKALSARDDAEAMRQATDKGLKAWVATQFGAESQAAQEFGFSPAKVAAKTAESKFKGALQAKATREARGTKGKRQKAAIKGAPVIVTTTSTVPATIVSAASPVANAPASANGSVNGAASTNGTTPSSH